VSIPGEENFILAKNLPLDATNPGSSLLSLDEQEQVSVLTFCTFCASAERPVQADAAGPLQYRTNNTLVANFQVNNLNELTADTNGGRLTLTRPLR